MEPAVNGLVVQLLAVLIVFGISGMFWWLVFWFHRKE